MLGGLALSVTGCYLALRRVRADIGVLLRRRGKVLRRMWSSRGRQSEDDNDKTKRLCAGGRGALYWR